MAGHLPPLVVHPDGRSELLEVAPSPPLGVGEGTIETKRFTVEDGSLFVLYTDGLVESRDRDITEGLDRLQSRVRPRLAGGRPRGPVQDLPGRRLLRRAARRHRGAHRQAAAHPGREPALLDAGTRVLLGADGAVHDQGPAQALGSRRPDPRHGTAGLRAGHQRDQVRQRRDPAAAHPRARQPDLRGARHLARAAPGAAGRQGRGERPRAARRVADGLPVGRAAHRHRQGRLVRAARPGEVIARPLAWAPALASPRTESRSPVRSTRARSPGAGRAHGLARKRSCRLECPSSRDFRTAPWCYGASPPYSTVTLLARLRGLSMSRPSLAAAW